MPSNVFRHIYAFFAPSDYISDYADKKIYPGTSRKYHHVLRFGFPRFDLTYKTAESTYKGGVYSYLESPFYA